MLHARPCPAEVHAGDAVEVLRVLVRDIRGRDMDASRIEGVIEAAELASCGLRGVGDLLLLGDVTCHSRGGEPGVHQLVRHGLHEGLVFVGQNDASPCPREPPCRLGAHAGARAGDEGNLACEVVLRLCHCSVPRASSDESRFAPTITDDTVHGSLPSLRQTCQVPRMITMSPGFNFTSRRSSWSVTSPERTCTKSTVSEMCAPGFSGS